MNLEYLLWIYVNLRWMLCKEKDLDVAILQMHTDDTHLQKDIKTVRTNAASAQVDFQKSPSSNLIWCKTFQRDFNDLLTDIELLKLLLLILFVYQ